MLDHRPSQRLALPLLAGVAMLGCGSPASPPAAVTSAAESPSTERAEQPRLDAGARAPGPSPDPQRAVPATEVPTSAVDAGVPAAAAPLPGGTTVLHIGDSFAGALGIDLNRLLKAAGVRGVLRYETSTYIPTWAHGKELDRYLWQTRPDLVLVTLGANELEHPDPPQRIPTIQKLVRRLGDRPCVWVGAPLWEGARPDLLEVIRAACAPCLYLDSSALVPGLGRARDGIHPSMKARERWAEAVVDWLARHRVPDAERPWQLRP